MPNRPYREVLIALAALAIGWLAHDSRPVHAAEPPAVYYQFSTGISYRYCTYSFRLGKLGGPIDRQNCPIGTLR